MKEEGIKFGMGSPPMTEKNSAASGMDLRMMLLCGTIAGGARVEWLSVSWAAAMIQQLLFLALARDEDLQRARA